MLEAYCDGGVCGPNPSALGGTWAWCHVLRTGPDDEGYRKTWSAGAITPEEAGLPAITNNLTELIAAVYCLEDLPDGWGGLLHTDSRITLCRVVKKPLGRKPAAMHGIPQWLQDRLHAVKARLGNYTVVLLGGHPTRAELAAGLQKDGYPVSVHNVWCDQECGIQSRRLKGSLATAA